jgi:urease accessory protein
MTGNLVVLLHLCDSLFPIGSFSHSDGLETATSQDQIRTAADLRSWMDVTLTESLRRTEGPGVSRAWRVFTGGHLDRLAAIDDELHALRPSSAGRQASRAMGTRLLKTSQQLRPHNRLERLLSERPAFTLPIAFGVVSAASAIPVRAAVEGFMYTRLAAVLSAAMRLMPIGQQEGHALLAGLLNGVPAIAADAVAEDAPVRSFTPALDLAAMNQQYGHSRLFRS